jgi:4-amino-4-deoxy-L-arabinose transferase-like glycosyltransferase
MRGRVRHVAPWAMLVLATLARLAVCAWMPLSADEAYYRVWSKALAPGYLDHPPMVALWIWAGTAIAGDTALGIRLLGPLAAMLGTILLVQAARDLAPPGRARAAGLRAGWLLNATLLLNAGAVIMTPDTPLLLFWTATLAAMARLIRTGRATWWLAAGTAAGLALDSKYTAFLLAPGLLAWMVAVPAARPWLRRWQPYAGAALAAALFMPVLGWNAAHGWASFGKQGGRGGDFHLSHALGDLAELLGGQIGLATPLVFAVFVAGVAACARRGRWRDPAIGLVLTVTALPALVFVQHALGDRVQGNWPSVIYPGAALAAGLAAIPFWRVAAASGIAVSGLLYVQGVAAPWHLPRRVDFTLIRLAGWDDLAAAAARAAQASQAGYIAADEYGLAAELAFRLASPVVGAEKRWALFRLPPAVLAGQTGLLVRSDRRAGGPDPAVWPGAVLVGHARRARAGIVAESYSFYRVTAPHGLPCVLLPDGVLPNGVQPDGLLPNGVQPDGVQPPGG